MAERHLGAALGAQRRSVGTGAGTSGGVEREHLSVPMDEGEQVAAHAAQVRRGDGDRCVGGDRRVDGVATEHQRPQAGLRGQLVGAGNQTLATSGPSEIEGRT